MGTDVVSGACLGERASMFTPVLVDPEDLDRRIGANAKAFAELKTSKDRPVEVCQVAGQLDTLTRLTCNDGSNPFTDRDAAHAARTGNVGQGGRCGSVIDLYVVPCPEGEYNVYMDLYVCPR
ncbi:MAG: hypothetical protein AAFV53_05510 [Myxococcota bacterium]